MNVLVEGLKPNEAIFSSNEGQNDEQKKVKQNMSEFENDLDDFVDGIEHYTKPDLGRE